MIWLIYFFFFVFWLIFGTGMFGMELFLSAHFKIFNQLIFNYFGALWPFRRICSHMTVKSIILLDSFAIVDIWYFFANFRLRKESSLSCSDHILATSKRKHIPFQLDIFCIHPTSLVCPKILFCPLDLRGSFCSARLPHLASLPLFVLVSQLSRLPVFSVGPLPRVEATSCAFKSSACTRRSVWTGEKLQNPRLIRLQLSVFCPALLICRHWLSCAHFIIFTFSLSASFAHHLAASIFYFSVSALHALSACTILTTFFALSFCFACFQRVRFWLNLFLSLCLALAMS